MIVYLNANLPIYFVEQSPSWGAKTAARLTHLRAQGHEFAVSDLTRLECLVKPLKTKDKASLLDFANFFALPHVHVLSMTGPVFDRAALVRATYGFKPLD